MILFIKNNTWLIMLLTGIFLFIVSITLLVREAIPSYMGWFNFLYWGMIFISMHMVNLPKKTEKEKEAIRRKREADLIIKQTMQIINNNNLKNI